MKHSFDSDVAHKAVQFGFMTEAAATYCFEVAQQQRKPFLLCAMELAGLSDQQAQLLASQEENSRRQGVMPIPKPGETVDGYEILERLGQGGMGCVYKARRRGEDREVAVKFLIESDEKARGRLAREAEALAQVGTHDHVVAIHGVGTYGRDIFLVLDYVPGQDLAAFVKKANLEPEESLNLVIKMARAVHFIHGKNILHRDLKPSNILIRQSDNEPILTDFGLAKSDHSQTLTQSEELLGTPYYMSPEQADGQNKTLLPASEVFSLGVILYELLTGIRPFQGQSFYELVAAILNREVAPPSNHNPQLPRGIDRVVLTALAKTPGERYQSMEEFADDCQRVLAGQAPIGASKDPLAPRRSFKFLPFILIMLAVAGAAVFIVYKHRGSVLEQEKWRNETLALYQSVKKHKAARDFRLVDKSLLLLSQYGQDQQPNPGASTLDLLKRFEELEARRKARRLEGEFSALVERAPLIQNLRVFRRRYQALTGQEKVLLNDPVERAFQLLFKGEYDEAGKQFEWTKSNRKEDLVLASLGLAVVAQKTGQFRIAKVELKNCFLKSEKIQFFTVLFQRAQLDEALQRVSRAQSRREVEEALKELRRDDKAPYQSKNDLSTAWIKALTRQLNQNENAANFTRIYEWLELCRPRYPRLATVQATPSQLGLLGISARKRGELLKAYEYFFKAARDPRFQLPLELTRDNLEGDIIHFLNTIRVRSDLWFKMTIDLVMLGARRGWVFGPLRRNFSDPALWPIIEKCIDRYGNGAFVRFFKGRLRPRFSTRAGEQSREDLTAALKSSRVKDEVRGAAHYELGAILYEASKSDPEKSESLRKQGVEQFEAAVKYKLPCPDKAYEMLFSLSKEKPVKIQYGRQALYWMHRRALRAQQAVDKEAIEEPYLVPYILGETDGTTRSLHYNLVKVLNNSGQFKEAMTEIERTWRFFKFDPDPIERAIARFGMKQIPAAELLKIVGSEGVERDLQRVQGLFPELVKKQ